MKSSANIEFSWPNMEIRNNNIFYLDLLILHYRIYKDRNFKIESAHNTICSVRVKTICLQFNEYTSKHGTSQNYFRFAHYPLNV